MGKISSYILSTYSTIFAHSPKTISDVGYELKGGTPIPSFEENILIDLCTEVQEILEQEDNVLELNGDFIIVGDIHGSFHDLLRIIHFIQEKPSKVLFLGDYVDRGSFSLECITILFAIKSEYPDSVYLIRGNHEFDSLCSQYGFKDEIMNYHNPKKQSTAKRQQNNTSQSSDGKPVQRDDFDTNYNDTNCYQYSEALYYSFIKAFSYLPIASIINNTTFCIHGGLGKKLDNIENINKLIQRPIDNFEDCKLLSDALWSDPTDCPEGSYIPNPRGRGNLFNNRAVSMFLKNNNLKRMIRAHECVEAGVLKIFDDKCITVFSASAYDNLNFNKSGILQIFEHDDSIKITSFPPLDRLKKSETTYYKVQSLNNKEDKKHVYFSLMHPRLVSGLSSGRMNQPKSLLVNSESCVGSYSNSPFVRPKFTTNRRQSYNNGKRSPLVGSASFSGTNYAVNRNKEISASSRSTKQLTDLFDYSDHNVNNE